MLHFINFSMDIYNSFLLQNDRKIYLRNAKQVADFITVETTEVHE